MIIKRIGKQEREHKVLLGLVAHYIQTGKAVSSNILKESGFQDLSSATLRNYFVNLEKKGFLTQSHSSGGRIPTHLALREYANHYLNEEYGINQEFKWVEQFDSREVACFLQKATEHLSHLTQCAAFLSAPRFDHDFIINIKLLTLDITRCLCVIITDFGVIQTEVLQLPLSLASVTVKKIENYFHRRLGVTKQCESLTTDEEKLAQTLYNELMLRYIVGYSNFVDEDIYRTGFSRLLNYPEFQEASLLASGLALFENVQSMRLLLDESKTQNQLKYWIGDDLANETHLDPNCAVIIVPYSINRKAAGAIGLLGPTRLPYRELFKTLQQFSNSISEALTRTLHKFKIDFRQPEAGKLYLQKEEKKFIGQSRLILIEDQRESEGE